MAVRYHTNLVDDGIAEVEAWVNAHAYDAIDHIDVYQHVVTMHGRNRDYDNATQTAMRTGHLPDDLDELFRRMWRS